MPAARGYAAVAAKVPPLRLLWPLGLLTWIPGMSLFAVKDRSFDPHVRHEKEMMKAGEK